MCSAAPAGKDSPRELATVEQLAAKSDSEVTGIVHSTEIPEGWQMPRMEGSLRAAV